MWGVRAVELGNGAGGVVGGGGKMYTILRYIGSYRCNFDFDGVTTAAISVSMKGSPSPGLLPWVGLRMRGRGRGFVRYRYQGLPLFWRHCISFYL